MLRIPSPDDVLHGPVVAGVDIGGTKITAVLADVDGNVLASDTTASGCGGQALIDAAAGLVTRIETCSGLRAAADDFESSDAEQAAHIRTVETGLA